MQYIYAVYVVFKFGAFLRHSVHKYTVSQKRTEFETALLETVRIDYDEIGSNIPETLE